ncbi:MAG TPA: pitrilysin family protein [Acidobacteriaceae bacterium]|nr:pitrilysin family protein [Acidobacteriaceae bacterium]
MSTTYMSQDTTRFSTHGNSLDSAQSRNIRRTQLDNGLVILTERMEHVRSVSMGVWVKTGSRDEQPEINGVSHFVEHMVFKGTKSRSAQKIAREVDAIGGNLDAFTSKETICFNMKVLDEHVPKALDVLTDLVMHPVFAPEDIDRECKVILEEIKMDEDNPDMLVHEIFTQSFWKDHPLGKPILGTRETVRRFDQGTLFDFYGGRFQGGNMIFSAAGNLDHEAFVRQVAEKLAHLSAVPAALGPLSDHPKVHARIVSKQKKSLEQLQLCLGVPAPAVNDEQRYTAALLNTILGGGMSSRLFQNVREDRGLAYSIFSELSSFRDTGSLCVYAGTSAQNAEQVIRLTVEEFRRIKEQAVPEEELQRAKDQLKGNILLSLESSGALMSNLARQEMYFQRFYAVPEILEKVANVTSEDLMRMAQQLFVPESVAVAMLGNLNGLKVTRDHLAC